MRAKSMLVRWTFPAPICTCMHKGDRSIRRPDEVSMAHMPTALPCTAILLLYVFRDCQLVICVMIKYPEDLAALDQSIVFGKSYHSSTDLSWVPSTKYADLKYSITLSDCIEIGFFRRPFGIPSTLFCQPPFIPIRRPGPFCSMRMFFRHALQWEDPP